ncbi:autorepressor SdpR family transcription factor [Syntrophomonas curvata]
MPLNQVFKALSDATRRDILHMLQQGDLSAGEIAEHFAITKPSISHHLNILKQAHLVQDVRKGQNIYYSLNTTVFQEVIGWFYDILDISDKAGNLNTVDGKPEAKERIDNGKSK